MMEKNPRTQPCLFVNLAEKVSIQNQIVIQTMDEILERAMMSPEQVKEKHTQRARKILQAVESADANSTRDEVPKPKGLSRTNAAQQQEV